MGSIINTNRLRYQCRDCGYKTYLSRAVLNRKNGDRCLNCGGRLEAYSNVALTEERKAARHGRDALAGGRIQISNI